MDSPGWRKNEHSPRRTSFLPSWFLKSASTVSWIIQYCLVVNVVMLKDLEFALLSWKKKIVVWLRTKFRPLRMYLSPDICFFDFLDKTVTIILCYQPFFTSLSLLENILLANFYSVIFLISTARICSWSILHDFLLTILYFDYLELLGAKFWISS